MERLPGSEPHASDAPITEDRVRISSLKQRRIIRLTSQTRCRQLAYASIDQCQNLVPVLKQCKSTDSRVNGFLATLVERLDDPLLKAAKVIPWSCPVPYFGDLSRSIVATLGINPSNREFVDDSGMELDGPARRLHTLKSLGILRWSQATSLHLSLIKASFREYFVRNPYNGWFRSLDEIISGTRASYYGDASCACHLDLV